MLVWIEQLQPLADDLDRALDAAVDIDLAAELAFTRLKATLRSRREKLLNTALMTL